MIVHVTLLVSLRFVCEKLIDISPGVVISCHLVAHVDLGEAEGAQMRVGALHRWLDGLPEQLVHKLADEWPHLLHRLREDRDAERVTQICHVQIPHGLCRAGAQPCFR